MIRVATAKGPSAIGMIQLFDDDDYDVAVFANPDEASARVVSGEADIAAVSANVAARLYQQSNHQIRVIAIGTLGMMCIVENGTSIQSVEDLRGKTLHSDARGKSPEYDLDYLLRAHGLDANTDVTINWTTGHSETVRALIEDDYCCAMLPQPFATEAIMKMRSLRVALDLNREWDRLQNAMTNRIPLVTGVVVARDELIMQDPGAVSVFLDGFAASIAFVRQHTEQAALLLEKHGVFSAELMRQAIPHCHITSIDGQEMQTMLSRYLEVLFRQSPSSVGGVLPDHDFYFIR